MIDLSIQFPIRPRQRLGRRRRRHGFDWHQRIGKDELAKALTLESAHALTSIFKKLGFLYVTLDLEGYRTFAFTQRDVDVS